MAEHGSTTELDSHEETSVFESECFIEEDTGYSVKVSGFTPDLPSLQNIPIVTAIIAYSCPHTFSTYFLRFRQVMHVSSICNNLLCTNQLRDYGVTVNNIPLI